MTKTTDQKLRDLVKEFASSEDRGFRILGLSLELILEQCPDDMVGHALRMFFVDMELAINTFNKSWGEIVGE